MPTTQGRGHLDFRDDSYRGTYWNNGTQGGPYLNSVSKEMLRNQKIAMSTKPSVPHGAHTKKNLPLLSREARFPNDKLSKSLTLFSETSGAMRSLPTTMPDKQVSVNVNHIRGAKTPVIWRDFFTGARTFHPSSNVDNWVEERLDRGYAGGRENGKYKMSNAEATMRQATALYTEEQRSKNLVKTVPDKHSEDFRNYEFQRRSGRPNYINYAKDDAALDTAMGGCYWVGTGPSAMYESVSRTAHSGRRVGKYESPNANGWDGAAPPLEFQRRGMNSDTKSRVLCGLKAGHKPEEQVQAAYDARWPQKVGGTSRWTSEYLGKFDSHVGKTVLMSDAYKQIHSEATDNILNVGVQGAGAFL